VAAAAAAAAAVAAKSFINNSNMNLKLMRVGNINQMDLICINTNIMDT